jgi:voltage-gated potassium channel
MKRWRFKLHEIIHEADTKSGKTFDVLLLCFIIISVILVALESISSFKEKYNFYLDYAEWLVTILFSIEYFLRIISVNKPYKYIFSFYGIIDLLSTLPKYISLFIIGSNPLISIRALRLLRIFRILKLTRYVGESNSLVRALKLSLPKVMVFMFSVIVLCIIFGTLMYMIESDQSGFTSVPKSIYWCIVTLTTVGYGDITPLSTLGQFLASFIMIMGYGIIAVPTGIVSAEFSRKRNVDMNTQACPNCNNTSHKDNSMYCYECGSLINEIK